MKRRGRKRRARQGELQFAQKRNYTRKTGRPPKGERAGVSHLRREALASRFPVHASVRLCEGLPRLRKKDAYRVLHMAFANGRERFGFRLCEYSIQSNHLHFLVEAKDRQALSKGMQGLLIRVAKRLNRLWGRKGPVFADRYWDRILRTPGAVRNALRYVLCNGRRHGSWRGRTWCDPFSSGPWFDGWKDCADEPRPRVEGSPVARARTWLLKVGWRRGGRIGLTEMPAG